MVNQIRSNTKGLPSTNSSGNGRENTLMIANSNNRDSIAIK